ncbi:MAG: hypothetical protein IPM95_05645 [Sphingobacteriales bacterium]|nr:hypothetical protein [Sphingobacteriales bacterium]
MKKSILAFVLLLLCMQSIYGQTYKIHLEKINNYLKTFDNGYYGYLEIKDGYLYDRFPSGKYSKSEIKFLTNAYESEFRRKVTLDCTDKKECVYSTYTDSYHNSIGFSTTTDFNTKELIDLLNAFLAAYKGTSNTITNTTVSTNTLNPAKTDRQKNARERQQYASSSTYSQIFSDELKKLNEYLKSFNPETYDKVEVKEGKVYFYFKVYSMVYNSSISISDLIQNTTVQNAKSVGEFGSAEIKIFCKGDKKCFYSTYSNGYADHFRFFSKTVKDLTKMEKLINDFIKSL